MLKLVNQGEPNTEMLRAINEAYGATLFIVVKVFIFVPMCWSLSASAQERILRVKVGSKSSRKLVRKPSQTDVRVPSYDNKIMSDSFTCTPGSTPRLFTHQTFTILWQGFLALDPTAGG